MSLVCHCWSPLIGCKLLRSGVWPPTHSLVLCCGLCGVHSRISFCWMRIQQTDCRTQNKGVGSENIQAWFMLKPHITPLHCDVLGVHSNHPDFSSQLLLINQSRCLHTPPYLTFLSTSLILLRAPLLELLPSRKLWKPHQVKFPFPKLLCYSARHLAIQHSLFAHISLRTWFSTPRREDRDAMSFVKMLASKIWLCFNIIDILEDNLSITLISCLLCVILFGRNTKQMGEMAYGRGMEPAETQQIYTPACVCACTHTNAARHCWPPQVTKMPIWPRSLPPTISHFQATALTSSRLQIFWKAIIGFICFWTS
jgi:hypothetical protein